MKKSIFLLLQGLVFSLPINFAVLAINNTSDGETVTVKSPANKVAVLELYTSEGCSSCPPADTFLNELKNSGISDNKIIPMAFHVTYWDYIGWKDRFASKRFDARQRDIARKARVNSVYTPQFVLDGKDFRNYSRFNKSVDAIVDEKATVDLSLTVEQKVDEVHLRLSSDISATGLGDVGIYYAVLEDNLSSDVDDGENEGVHLYHNYVVRKLSVPYLQSKPNMEIEQLHVIKLDPMWKKSDLSIVAFAENPHTGEVLQAVRYRYR